jgi:hypothetical protein
MKLYFVFVNIDGENLDWFVRAHNPREAFTQWRTVPMVSNYFVGLGDYVAIIEAPTVDGPVGPIDWPFNDRHVGRIPEDFRQ